MFKNRLGLMGAIAGILSMPSASVHRTAGTGNTRSKHIKNHNGAWARTGSVKFINHDLAFKMRREAAAHNDLLDSMKQDGILSKAGNVKPGCLGAYNLAIQQRLRTHRYY